MPCSTWRAPDCSAASPTNAVDARGRPLRDLRVSVIETCNYRCPYCMPEGLTPEESALDRSRRLSFDEIETAVRSFVRLGVRKVRLTGGEPLLRRNLPELVARLARYSRHRRPGADHQRLAAGRAGRSPCARPGCIGITVSLDALDPGSVPRAVWRTWRGRPMCWPESRPRRRPDSHRSSSTRWCSAASTRTRSCRWSSASAARRMCCASSNTWTSAPATDGGARTWSRRANCAIAIAARWPLRPLVAKLSRRSRRALCASRTGRARSVSSARSASRSAATATARGCRPTDSCSPACSPRAGSDLRAALADGEAALTERIAGLWGVRGDRYSELRGDRWPRSQENRNVLHRRLNGSKLTHVDAGGRPAMVDVSGQGRRRPGRHAPSAW